MIRLMSNLDDFTAASQRSRKCGAADGMNFHYIPWVDKASVMLAHERLASQNIERSVASAPWNVVVLLLQTSAGSPRRPEKRHIAANSKLYISKLLTDNIKYNFLNHFE